jgi:hypothetical protein
MTSTYTNVFVNTATITPAPTYNQTGTLEITDLETWPNPYNPKTKKIYLGYTLTQDADEVALKIYSVSFRLVSEAKLSAADSAGKKIKKLNSINFNDMANGSYYYILTAKKSGKQSHSKANVILIIK